MKQINHVEQTGWAKKREQEALEAVRLRNARRAGKDAGREALKKFMDEHFVIIHVGEEAA